MTAIPSASIPTMPRASDDAGVGAVVDGVLVVFALVVVVVLDGEDDGGDGGDGQWWWMFTKQT